MGVNVGLFVVKVLLPILSSNQLISKPISAFTSKAGIITLAQISTFIPVGGFTTLQLQSGADTVNICEQLVVELVMVISTSVPEFISEIVNVPSILSATIPSVDETLSASVVIVVE